ncbi:MAG: hypothetical protein JSV15_03405 [Candidatus Bathyarchaeota archaeon]|nr:MAG: hypothetical protein JSV15_03405 [Candidatus Bathyarchaeota archaeon]
MIIVQMSDLHCASAPSFLREKLTTAINEINHLNPDLVASDHRHRPWLWKLNDINFLFSGAVSTVRLRGFFENSYNVIRIENREIKPTLKVVGDSFTDFPKLT